VFFNLLRFKVPLRAKKYLVAPQHGKKWLSETLLAINIYKKTENPIFGGTPSLSRGTPGGHHCPIELRY